MGGIRYKGCRKGGRKKEGALDFRTDSKVHVRFGGKLVEIGQFSYKGRRKKDGIVGFSYGLKGPREI